MMRTILFVAAACTLLAAPAFATNKPNTPAPTAITNTPVAHGGSARAAALGVGVGIAAPRQRQTATGGQGGNVTVTGSGGGYYGPTDRLQAPNVQAPAIWSNNPCVVALSGGVSVAGFGASVGAGIEDRDCTRRANAQHLTAMGEREAAREVLCESREVRAAFQRIGRPCVADQPQVTGVHATAPATTPLPTPAAARNLPAYCSVPGIQNSECRN